MPLSTALCQDESAGQSGNENEARRLYSLGSEAFDAGRFSEAAVYFGEAYDAAPLPDLLNAGAALQRGEEDADAIRAFERYLQNHPGGSHEGEVNARLVVLRRRVATQTTGQNTSPSAAQDTDVEPESSNTNANSLQNGSTSPAPSRAVPLALIIGGAATVAAGTTFLIVAGGARSTVEDASGFYSSVEADDSRASTFGVVGGVALGVGAALVGVGVVLWATGGSTSDDDTGAYSGLRVGLGSAEWTTSW